MQIQVVKRVKQKLVIDLKVFRFTNQKGERVLCVNGYKDGELLSGYSKTANGMNNLSKAFGEWFEQAFQPELQSIAHLAMTTVVSGVWVDSDGLYGLNYYPQTGKVKFEKRVGMRAIRQIIACIGYEIEVEWNNSKAIGLKLLEI
jgi:hypothetical protein